jgi:phospholipase C
MADPIEHVVVLMMENSSFDRMLGAIPGVDGVDPANPETNPDFPDTALVTQQATEARNIPDDPEHDLDDVLDQISGPCEGFVRDFAQHYPQSQLNERSEIMAYYDRGTLPALHALAESFAICDRWFSSLPGPTWPNRFFVHSGTSLGHVKMPNGLFQPNLHLYNQPTVYQRLSEKNIEWAIYYGDFPQSLVMTEQSLHLDRYHRMEQFFRDASGPQNAFPQYAFIEPSYFGAAQNDQHPPSDVFAGEALIASVYNALVQNEELWNNTLFVVLYDEHGGFYDHVEPPAAVPPDNNTKEFAFNQYGVRVPALLISPWIDHQVIHDVFDHTSLLKYATEKWNLGPLGQRVAAAEDFGGYLTQRQTARVNAPGALPIPAASTNPAVATLNANQNALVAFSRFLETKIADGAGNTDEVLRSIGQRLVNAIKNGTQAEAAVERLKTFLSLKAGGLSA